MPCNSGTWQLNVKANTLFRKVLRFSKKKMDFGGGRNYAEGKNANRLNKACAFSESVFNQSTPCQKF